MCEVGSLAEGKDMYIMGILSGASSLSKSKYSSNLNNIKQDLIVILLTITVNINSLTAFTFHIHFIHVVCLKESHVGG